MARKTRAKASQEKAAPATTTRTKAKARPRARDAALMLDCDVVEVDAAVVTPTARKNAPKATTKTAATAKATADRATAARPRTRAKTSARPASGTKSAAEARPAARAAATSRSKPAAKASPRSDAARPKAARTTARARPAARSRRTMADDHGSQMTTDHAVIRRWIEERGGCPSTVEATRTRGKAGVLRVDFPESPTPRLEDIAWDEFFRKFDEKQLAFLYQEHTADGSLSRFSKFVSRPSAGGRGRK